MTKLFIFTDWFLPAHKAGGPIKSLDNMINLLRHDFEIYVFTSNLEFDSTKTPINVTANEWVQMDGYQVYYASRANFYSKLKSAVKSIQPNIVYLNSIFSFRYSLLPLALNKFSTVFNSARFVLAPRGMLQSGALTIKPIKKKIALYFLNGLGWYKNIYFHATDQVEIQDIKDQLNIKDQMISMVSNVPLVQKNGTLPFKKDNVLRLVFIARLSKKKNLRTVLESLKSIDAGFDINLEIYGPDELNYLESLAPLVAEAQQHCKIDYFGDLEFNEVTDKLLKNHVYILPSLGENFGHSIFEAMSAGLPVIISDKTPWRNLKEEKVGFDIPLAQPNEFVEAIQFFAKMNNKDFAEWSRNAKNFALDYYKKQDFKAEYKQLFNVYKKVGIVGPIPLVRYKGGISVFIEQLLKRQASFNQEGLQLVHLNTCVVRRKNDSIGKMRVINLYNYCVYMWRSIKTIRRERIQQLHVHTSIGLSLIKDSFSACVFRYLLGQKIILHIHFAEEKQLLPSSFKWFTKRLIKNSAHQFIVLSNSIKKYLTDAGVPAAQIHQINNFHFQVDPIIALDKRENETKIITFIGSLDERKGILDLMTAMGNLDNTNWQLHLVGEFIDEVYKTKTIERCKVMKIEDKTIFHGYLDEAKKNDILQVTDILVLPSYAEGMPLTILEGLAFGTAIVATNVGANSEFLKGVCNLVPSGDVAQIAHEIDQLLGNEALLNSRKRQSKDLANQFTFNDFFQKIIPVYQIKV